MRWTWFFIGIGTTLIVGMLCGSALILGLLPRMYPGVMAPHTHAEAVMQVLEQHGIAYHDLQISDSCPPMPQCWEGGRNDDTAYAAQLVVAGAQPRDGQIICRHRRTDCVLIIAVLGLHSVPLPPLAQNQPWLDALKRQIRALEVWCCTDTMRLHRP
jgi:hypothetical protein